MDRGAHLEPEKANDDLDDADVLGAAETARHLGVPLDRYPEYERAVRNAKRLHPPVPLVQLAPDDELRQAERLYEPEELADPAFVYREMLFMRTVVDSLQDQIVVNERAEWRRRFPAETERWFGPASEEAVA